MYSSIVLLAVGAAMAVYGATPKEAPAKGYYDAAQSQPSYPAQSAPAYPAQPPVYYQPVYTPPQYALPNVDVNYCTVHATFPLVERKHHRHHHRNRRQVYGQQDSYGGVQQAPATGYGQAPATGYGQAPAASYPLWPSPFTGHHSRRYEREHCRYSAIFDQATCQTCCQIASAAAGTDTSLVTGALFVFDPKIDRDQYYDSKSKSDEHKDDKDDKRVLQCICCLPKPL